MQCLLATCGAKLGRARSPRQSERRLERSLEIVNINFRDGARSRASRWTARGGIIPPAEAINLLRRASANWASQWQCLKSRRGAHIELDKLSGSVARQLHLSNANLAGKALGRRAGMSLLEFAARRKPSACELTNIASCASQLMSK